MPRTSQHAIDRTLLAEACAIAHGRAYRMSMHELLVLVLEDGLPGRVEREKMLADRLEGKSA